MDWEMDMTFKILSPDGFHYEVSSDPDGLNTVQLNYFEDDDKEPVKSIIISEEAIPFLIKALQKHADNFEDHRKKR